MNISLTYLDDLSRVRISVTGVDDTHTTAHVERSLDEITWQTVRGGQAATVTGGSFHLDDYEFTDATLNTYRVTTSGASTNLLTANQASIETDVSGWVASLGCTIARTTDQAAHGVASVEVTSTSGSFNSFVDNSPAQTIAEAGKTYTAVAEFRAAVTPRICQVVLVWLDELGGTEQLAASLGTEVTNTTTGWTQATVTGVAPPGTAAVEMSLRVIDPVIGEVHYIDKIGLFEGSSTTWALPTETASQTITPVLDTIWIKSLTRPFLNRKVTLTDFSEVERPSRNGVFAVVGRTFPVAVTDLRLGRQQEISLLTHDQDERRELDLVLASGDPVFLHCPDDCPVDTMYAVVGDVSYDRTQRKSARRIFTLPLTEVAAPDASIVGSTVTWANIIANFATWADLIAAEATWADVLDRIGDPTDVIVE